LQQQILFKAKQLEKNPFKFGIPERKLMIFFFYNALVGIVGLSVLSSFARKSDFFMSELVKYFTCEFNGHDPLNPCDRSVIEGVQSDGATILVFLISGSFSAVNLVFVISIQGIKKQFRSLREKVRAPRVSSNPVAEVNHYRRYEDAVHNTDM
jgi:hypothetical protein